MSVNIVKPIPLPQNYSAKIINSNGDVGAIYISEQKRRTESAASGELMIVIARLDKNLLYTIFPGTKQHIVTSIASEMRGFILQNAEEDGWEFVQKTIICETPVHLFNVYQKHSNTPYKRIYLDPATSIRVRTIMLDKNLNDVSIIDCCDVQIGQPKDELFELPPDSTAVS